MQCCGGGKVPRLSRKRRDTSKIRTYYIDALLLLYYRITFSYEVHLYGVLQLSIALILASISLLFASLSASSLLCCDLAKSKPLFKLASSPAFWVTSLSFSFETEHNPQPSLISLSVFTFQMFSSPRHCFPTVNDVFGPRCGWSSILTSSRETNRPRMPECQRANLCTRRTSDSLHMPNELQLSLHAG